MSAGGTHSYHFAGVVRHSISTDVSSAGPYSPHTRSSSLSTVTGIRLTDI
jgi:hypothetical protein